MSEGNSYTAKLGLDASELSREIREAVGGLEDFMGKSNEMDKDLKQIQSTLNTAAGGLERFAKSANDAGTQAGSSAGGINKAVKSLQAYDQVTSSITKNLARGQLGFNASGLSEKEIASFGAFQVGANVAQQKAQIFYGVVKAAEDEYTARVEQESRTRTNAYTREYQQAIALDKQLEAQRKQGEAKKSTETSGRGYANASTISDDGIAQRAKESAEFAAGAKQRFQEFYGEVTAAENEYTKAVQAGSARRTADYTRQFNEAIDQERRLQAQRDAARYSNPAVASRNGASYFAQQQAQAEYATRASNDQLAQMRDHYLGIERAAREAEAAQVSGLARLRYALFDVSNLLATAGLGLVAVGPAVSVVAVQWQKDFAEVARTSQATGEDLKDLRADFVGLAQDLPTSFGDLTQIGALAGQLGVAQSQIASFTETAAKFTATTNVTAEAAATAFGRLDALLPGVEGNFNGLGSSILQVGINSVATESDIVSTSSQIAAAGAQAGLTAGEVIGLSGALASLGVAPEAARGTVLRFFSLINSAVSNGGQSLDDFAKVSGMTADQFRTQWSSDFTGTFVSFLEGINSEGRGAESALNGLGITATRDVSALLKLSQSTDLVADSLNNGTKGFAEGTALGNSFAITAETVSSKIAKLGNNFQAFMDALGQGTLGPLSAVVDGLTGMLQVLTELANNPVLATFVALGAVVATLAGAIAIGTAAYLRYQAGLLATRTAFAEAITQGTVLPPILTRVAASYGLISAAQLETAAATHAANAALARSGGVAASASTGVSTLSKFLGKAGLLGALLLLLGPISEASAGLASMATDAARNIAGTSLTVQNFTGDIQNAKTAIENLPTPFANQAGATGDAFAGLYGFESFIKSVVGNVPIATTYLTQMNTDVAKVDQALLALLESGRSIDAADLFGAFSEKLTTLGYSTEQIAEFTNGYNQRLTELGGSAGAAANDVAVLSEQMKENLGVLQDTVGGQLAAQNALYALGESLYTNGDAFGYYSSEGRANIQALQAAIDGYTTAAGGDAQALANYLGSLYNYILQNTSAPVQALAMLQAAISATGAKPVAGLGTSMTSLSQGFQKAKSTAAAAAAKIGGGGGGSVGSAAGSAAKKVRTLTDYVSDLSSIMGNAFKIRFDSGTALDAISSGWNNIADSISDAADKQREINAAMSSLASDKSLQQYYLSIAEKYGEQERAGVLRGKIADIDAELAQKQKELADAQDEANQSLKGNTKGAIANRAEVLGLVGDYRDYITALANSGLSQEELKAKVAQLKKEFIEQGRSMGYNTEELATYAKGFDDFSTIIAKLPRDITLSVNVDPALRALEEYTAKLAAANAGGGGGGGGGGGAGAGLDLPDPGAEGALAATEYYAGYSNQALKSQEQQLISQINWWGRIAQDAKDSGDTAGYEYATSQVATLRGELALVNLEEEGRKAGGTWNAGYGVTVSGGSAKTLSDMSLGLDAFALKNQPKGTDAANNFNKGFSSVPQPQPNITPRAPATDGANAAYDFWGGFNSVINTIAVGATTTTSKGARNGTGKANGGAIYGPGTGTSDSVPIMASNGEYMIRAKAARAAGLPFLNSLNSLQPGRQLRFASGGPIGGGSKAGMSGPSQVLASLSAEDRALLREVRDAIGNIEVDFVDAAEAVAKGNKRLQGSN